jgi:hypothetical protein
VALRILELIEAGPKRPALREHESISA